jgi:hypothetical protein
MWLSADSGGDDDDGAVSGSNAAPLDDGASAMDCDSDTHNATLSAQSSAQAAITLATSPDSGPGATGAHAQCALGADLGMEGINNPPSHVSDSKEGWYAYCSKVIWMSRTHCNNGELSMLYVCLCADAGFCQRNDWKDENDLTVKAGASAQCTSHCVDCTSGNERTVTNYCCTGVMICWIIETYCRKLG